MKYIAFMSEKNTIILMPYNEELHDIDDFKKHVRKDAPYKIIDAQDLPKEFIDAWELDPNVKPDGIGTGEFYIEIDKINGRPNT